MNNERYLDPPEYSGRVCPECDQWMEEISISRGTWLECRNPDCPECAARYKRDDDDND